MTFGDRLGKAMRSQGMDAEELAARTEIQKHLIESYVECLHLPGAVNLKRLAQGLGVSMDWLTDCELIRCEDDGRSGRSKSAGPLDERQLPIPAA